MLNITPLTNVEKKQRRYKPSYSLSAGRLHIIISSIRRITTRIITIKVSTMVVITNGSDRTRSTNKCAHSQTCETKKYKHSSKQSARKKRKDRKSRGCAAHCPYQV